MSDPSAQSNETIDEVVAETLRGDVPRRDFLRRVVRLGVSSAVAYKLLDETTAMAQSPGRPDSGPKFTTFAIGEEGNPPKTPVPPLNGVTTKAVGEEANRVLPTHPRGSSEESSRPTTYGYGEEQWNGSTTMAIGEENPKPPSNRPTTMAIGEEQPNCPTPGPTTKAVGEEAQPPIRPTTLRNGEESKVTTGARGEESSDRPKATTLIVGEEGKPGPNPGWPPRGNMTTQAVGEESNGKPANPGRKPTWSNPIPTPWKNFRRW